jgi:hypothetical protein
LAEIEGSSGQSNSHQMTGDIRPASSTCEVTQLISMQLPAEYKGFMDHCNHLVVQPELNQSYNQKILKQKINR